MTQVNKIIKINISTYRYIHTPIASNTEKYSLQYLPTPIKTAPIDLLQSALRRSLHSAFLQAAY